MKISLKQLLAAATLLLSGLAGGSVQANTITIIDPDGNPQFNVATASDQTANLTLAGWLANGTVSNIQTAAFVLPNADPSTEANQLNLLAGTSFATGTQTNTGGLEHTSFVINTEYFSLKIDGPNVGTAYLHNLTGGALTIFYDILAGTTAGGLSHYTTYGAAAVPLPVAGAGLPGIVAACGGLFLLGRRRRRHFVG